jgi:hypothetical protein
VLTLVVGTACSDREAGVAGGRFDADRAFADLRHQVDHGPRPAGSAASRRLADWLVDRVPDGRFEPVPGGLRNVVGVLPGRAPAILLGAHYDTDDIPGFVGANDGAGGTATVLEVARALAADRRSCDREIRVVLFDGEEEPRGSDDFERDALRGSRAYLAAHPGELAEVVIVDFVADKDLSLPREAGSDPGLWRELRSAAAAVGTEAFFPGRVRGEILDDHTPFARAGIPAIDLIDFDYPHWDRPTDTLDKVSAQSLDVAGETLVELLGRRARAACAPEG